MKENLTLKKNSALKKKSHFIIGDVHGCLPTLKALLKHWQPKEQQLISVGDIVGHGKYSPQTVEYLKGIIKENPDTVILRGNHEEQFHRHCLEEFNDDWYEKTGEDTFKEYLMYGRQIDPDAKWFSQLPLHFETSYLLVSHAGVSHTDEPFNSENPEGVVWHRSEIKKLDQLQVYGHTPKEQAVFDASSNAINIDTGAYKCNKLTAIVVNNLGEIVDMVDEPTHTEDLPNEKEECIL